MPIDLRSQLGAVTRAVETRTRDGHPVHVVVAARTYDTTVGDLWDALTSKERIPRWFLPVSGDLRLGGRYQLHGNASGTITRCEPPNELGLTWEFGGEVTWVDVHLTPTPDGRAHLELEHAAPAPHPRWDEFGPGAVGVGWDSALAGLGWHLITGESADPAAAMAWLMSHDGKTFLRESADGWCRAAIDSGDNPESAKAAAARTFAAYTGAGADVAESGNARA